MKRTLACAIALLLPLSRGVAQQATVAGLPIVRPKITVIGTLRDSMLPWDAALSPNGKLVAFTPHAPLARVAVTELRILNVRTGEQNLVHTGNVNTLTWGPKGDAISFARADPEARDKFLWTIRIDSITGKALEPARRVGLHRIRYAPYFSPDERLIAYAGATAEDAQATGSRRSTYSLVVVPANGGAERVLATGIDLRSLRWTPDGSAIRYRTYVDSTMKAPQHFQVPVTGGTPVRIAERVVAPRADGEDVWGYTDPVRGETVAGLAFPRDISVSDWSRTNHLVGVREIHPRGLRVVNLVDGKSRQLVDTSAEVSPPEWFADGQRIATFVRKSGKLSLSVMRADGSEARQFALTLPPFSIQSPRLQVSPDGRYAAFVSEPNGDEETIELMDLSTGKQRTLWHLTADATAPEGKGIGTLSWTGDSERIRYMSSIWTSEDRSVHEVTLSGADKLLRPLPKSAYPMLREAGFPSANAAASPNTDANVVALWGGPNLTFVPIDSGAARVVFRNSIIGGSLSPDRRTMAVKAGKLDARMREPTQRVTLIALQDLSTRDIKLPFIELPGIAWHPDGQHFFMIGRERAGGPANLYSVPTNGAAPKMVAPIGPQPEDGAIAVSPNGNFVAVTISAAPSATLLRLDFDVQAVIQAGTKK